MRLEIILSGDKSGQEGTVRAEGNMQDICTMLITGILDLYENFEKAEGVRAADLFRVVMREHLSDSQFPGLYEAYKRDTAVPMSTPGYIHVAAQK